MDERTLRVLEYPGILDMLAERAACTLGRTRARAITPAVEVGRIRVWLKETSEAVALINDWGLFPFGALSDISELLSKAGAGVFAWIPLPDRHGRQHHRLRSLSGRCAPTTRSTFRTWPAIIRIAHRLPLTGIPRINAVIVIVRDQERPN